MHRKCESDPVVVFLGFGVVSHCRSAADEDLCIPIVPSPQIFPLHDTATSTPFYTTVVLLECASSSLSSDLVMPWIRFDSVKCMGSVVRCSSVWYVRNIPVALFRLSAIEELVCASLCNDCATQTIFLFDEFYIIRMRSVRPSSWLKDSLDHALFAACIASAMFLLF